jgi:hypothetical protein
MKRLVFLLVLVMLAGFVFMRAKVESSGMYNIVVIDTGKVIQNFTSKHRPYRMDGYWMIEADHPVYNFPYEINISDRAIVEWSLEEIKLNQ